MFNYLARDPQPNVQLAEAAVLAASCSVLLFLRFRSRKAGTARNGRHRRYQARAEAVIHRLREIDPIRNPARAFSYLRSVNPYVFEEMVLTLLARRHLKIERSQSYSGDGGVDGAFDLDGQRWLIQAKRYHRTINSQHVEAFEQVCRKQGVQGMFIHTGRTGPSSRAVEVAAKHVRIVSGDDLLALIAGERFNLFDRTTRTAQASPARRTTEVPDLVVTGSTNSRLRRR